MALTPMDIHNKEFERSFRGYNEDEVDQFLDNIVDEFEKIYKENMEMKERISILMDQISQFRTMEKTLKDTLVTAQKTADEVTSVAQQKAKLILREAEEQARQIRANANQDVVEANKEQFEIKKQIRILKMKIRTLLESQIEEIDQLAEDDDSSTIVSADTSSEVS
ncbi:MAG: DivIVA domain-containing protein [Clostridiales bacterium]|nr:DivIVA domain-containing protein [Clostridiales bacterium]